MLLDVHRYLECNHSRYFDSKSLEKCHPLTEFSIVALADAEQRIYDFIGADPERLNHFRECFAPKEIDLGGENHRSAGSDIARFGNDLLNGTIKGTYKGMRLVLFPANENQALAALKGQTLQARQRLIAARNNNWSLAVLVPTKRMMRHVSDAFRTNQGGLPVIAHHAAIDMESAILAAEILAFLLQPHSDPGDFAEFVELTCNFFRGRGGADPAVSDIEESLAIQRAYQKAANCRAQGKDLPARSIMRPMIDGYDRCASEALSGNPDNDWVLIRDSLANCGCKRLAEVADEARNVRLLDRGTQLRDALSSEWRARGRYANALAIVRQAFVREHFATSGRTESGVVVMNMHKAKGKQFDEVIIFEGWPRTQQGRIVANSDRIVRGNSPGADLTHARHNFRVSITRAKVQTTIMTPKSDPCILLRARPDSTTQRQ